MSDRTGKITNANQAATTLQQPGSNYMIQLDSLRAIAVFGVLVHHFLPQDFILNSRFHWGPLGVRFFFVLSGFLITGILLRCKDLVDLENQSSSFTLKRFLIRRVLRLAPIYYLYLLATSIFAFQSVKDSLPWHLIYASNIYFSIHEWDAYTSHFWTLSVEEQFYLFWAFLLILIPKRYLLIATISIILVAPLFRVALFLLGWDNGIREYILVFSCFDSLGLGALLALFSEGRNHHKKRHKKILTQLCFWIGLPLFIALNFITPPGISNSVILMFGFTSASMFFVWVINKAAQGFGGWTGKILSFQPMVYLGKISYGIYVYHLLTPPLLYKIFGRLGLLYPDSVWLKFCLQTLATLIIAALSWHLIENPINALKRNFEYRKS